MEEEVQVQPQQPLIINIINIRNIHRAGRILPALHFYMKKPLYSIISLAILLLFQHVPCLNAQSNETEVDRILSSAESLFKAMKERSYPTTWFFLSEKSRNTIIDDVSKAVNKTGAQYTKENISRDFVVGGLLCRSYWDHYLEHFDPDTVLEQSTWEMGRVEKKRAEIIVRYKKSERPATLKMYKEEGLWRLGLEETFRSSRR